MEGYYTKVSSSHFRICISIKTFVVAAFESKMERQLYKWNKIRLNGYNHSSKSFLSTSGRYILSKQIFPA